MNVKVIPAVGNIPSRNRIGDMKLGDWGSGYLPNLRVDTKSIFFKTPSEIMRFYPNGDYAAHLNHSNAANEYFVEEIFPKGTVIQITL